MKTHRRFVSFALASLLVLTLVLRADGSARAAQAGPPVPPSTSGLPDTPTTALFVRVCGDCHEVDRTTSRRRTRAEWRSTILQMEEDGAEGSEQEFASILDFLVVNFGAVAVNTAKSEDLATVLHFSAKDADAIVAFRTANGPFADFEALKAVPGLDVSQLEQKKASIRF